MVIDSNISHLQIERDTPEEIIRETKKMLEIGYKGGRFAAAVNTIVSENIPLKNYLVFWQTIKQYNETFMPTSRHKRI